MVITGGPIRISEPAMGREEADAVAAVLASGNLVQGPKVKEFEEAFASFIGVPHAVAVSSGTAALQLGLQSVVGPGDEVITSPFSFVATSNAILYAGATPVFVDIDPQTFVVSPAEIEKKITKKTKAVLVVHLYGLPCDMEKIKKICTTNNLLLIEDCAQSCGASVDGQKTGSFGDLACFSFYATKNLCTGEGGMVTTSSPSVAEQCRILRSQGQSGQYNHVRLGYNFRMTEMQAALGTVQLKRLEELNNKRKEHAEYLSRELYTLPFLRIPTVPDDATHAWHQFTVRVPGRRDRLQSHLAAAGIDSRVYYPRVIYQQPVYQQLGYKIGQCPEAEQAAEEVLSLPIHPRLSESDLRRIVSAIKSFRL